MRNSKRGFTLIELLVVVAIIAILAAILFPIFAAARASARNTQCISGMNQIGKAMRSYTAEWGGMLPECALGGSDWYQNNNGCWERKLAAFIEASPDIFVCPETKAYYQPGKLMTSYSMNGHLSAVGALGASGVVSPANAANPSKLIVIFETNCKSRPAGTNYNVSLWDQSNEFQSTTGEIYGQDGPDGWWFLRFPGPHKGGNENILFADAHVKGFKRWNSTQMTFLATEDPK